MNLPQRFIRWLYLKYVFIPLTDQQLMDEDIFNMLEDEYDEMNPLNIARAMHERQFNGLH